MLSAALSIVRSHDRDGCEGCDADSTGDVSMLSAGAASIVVLPVSLFVSSIMVTHPSNWLYRKLCGMTDRSVPLSRAPHRAALLACMPHANLGRSHPCA